jgi:hypothetical protein
MASLTPRTSGRSVFDFTRDPMAPPKLVIKAILDGIDAIAREMERKWGVDRLRLLVGDTLRIKFDAQKAKLDAAIAAGQETYIRAQAEGMRRAWLALDRAATEDGARALAPEVWQCVLPASGEVVSIVRTEAEAHHVARDGEVWTLAEVAVLIERLGAQIRQVRRRFPGAAVVEIRDGLDEEERDARPSEQAHGAEHPKAARVDARQQLPGLRAGEAHG